MTGKLIAALLAAACGIASAGTDWYDRIATPNTRFYRDPTGAAVQLWRAPSDKPLVVRTLACTSDLRTSPGKVACTGKPDAAITAWLAEAQQCGQVTASPLAAADATKAARELAAFGSFSPPGSLTKDELLVAATTHVKHERVLHNSCTGVAHSPCDPHESWATDELRIMQSSTLELVSASARTHQVARGPFHLALPILYYGRRTGGWFMPDPLFRWSTVDRKVHLDRVLAARGGDDDENLALALSRASFAVAANDPRTARLATAFVTAATARPAAQLHHELRRTVLDALPVMRAIATGELVTARPCGGKP